MRRNGSATPRQPKRTKPGANLPLQCPSRPQYKFQSSCIYDPLFFLLSKQSKERGHVTWHILSFGRQASRRLLGVGALCRALLGHRSWMPLTSRLCFDWGWAGQFLRGAALRMFQRNRRNKTETWNPRLSLDFRTCILIILPSSKNFDRVVFQFQASENDQKYLVLFGGSAKMLTFPNSGKFDRLKRNKKKTS